MHNVIPRVAAVHDLSGFGRCSLAVIMPVLSTMGIQVCPVPTAVLSTHSGGFTNFLFHDLTDTMTGYIDHWQSMNLTFDCLYSGFLGSERQIDIVEGLLTEARRKGKSLIVVDPVMGDHGKLYKTYTPEMKKKMGLLVEKADIITPNLTEACFLLEETYEGKPMGAKAMKELLRKLSQMGPKRVVITGIADEEGYFSNIGFSREEELFWRVKYKNIPVHYPGTGDIFTSVLVGSLLLGDNFPMAIDRATQFISHAVRITYGYRTPEREGVMLEKVLGWLNNPLTQCTYEMIDE